MRKIYLLPVLFMFFTNCKNPKADLNGNEKISAEDFIKAFHQTHLPIIIRDTALKNFGDTTIISKAVFTQFIPDTTFAKFSDSLSGNFLIHAAGIIHQKEKDFLLITFSSLQQTKLGVFVLDDKHKFLASFPLLNTAQKDSYQHSVSITEEPTFIMKREKNTANNLNLYSRNGFAYSSTSNSFSEVLHDSNEDTAKNNEIINPIDTLPSTNKFSGDYMADKRNYISVRDGKNASAYAFFIHFEKNNGKCIGELKGTMNLTDAKNAVFAENADACVIDFKFMTNTIKIKEQGNCGNHRGITCPFDFTFKKKTQSKKKIK